MRVTAHNWIDARFEAGEMPPYLSGVLSRRDTHSIMNAVSDHIPVYSLSRIAMFRRDVPGRLINLDQKSIFDYSLNQIETLEGVTRDAFDERIRAAGRPVLMKGLVEPWPAVEAANTSLDKLVDHLKALDIGATVPTFVAPPNIEGRYFYTPDMSRFNFERREAPFHAILDKLLEQRKDAQPMGIYAGASPTVQTLPAFATHNPMPLVDADVVPKIWVGNSSKVAPHFDISENIACVVSGVRRFVIFPPDQIENLYVGPIDYNMAGQPASLVDMSNIDLEKFPKFEDAIQHAIIAELHPGDALYLPSLWWHFVESTGPLNVLVNYWFDQLRDGSPMNVLALALLVLRDLPQNDKDAWRSVFEHYVFGHDAAKSAAHIPEAFRGVLADKSLERDRKIKAFLQAQLPAVLR
jgi:hypothetical protein